MPRVDESPEALGYLRVDLDWEAYYVAFKEIHGDPVKYGEKLLFADGWMYSSTDPAGPEYRPPDDIVELRALQLRYWTERRRTVVSERNYLRNLTHSLEALQKEKSAPLQRRVVTVNEDGKMVDSVVPLDIESIRMTRLLWLEGDVEECEKKLKELRDVETASRAVA